MIVRLIASPSPVPVALVVCAAVAAIGVATDYNGLGGLGNRTRSTAHDMSPGWATIQA